MPMRSIGGIGFGDIFTTPLTQNSIPFVDANGKLSQDNVNLIWDDTLKKLHLKGDTLEIGTVLIEDSNGCLTTTEFHAHGKDGVSGYLKIKQGTTPSAHAEANHSILWVNSSEKLMLEKPDGTDLEIGRLAAALTQGSIPFIDANGMLSQDNAKLFWDNINKRLGIGTNTPKQEFDFNGANARTQRYVDISTNINLGDQTFGAGNLITGGYNSAFGRKSLYNITSGQNNCGFGNEALFSVTTGGNNIGIAGFAGKLINTGEHNINIGYKSGYAITGGNNNINIGSYCNYIGTGSKNIIIGYNIDLPVNGGDNQLNIGNLIFGTGLDGVDKTLSTGKVGIGTNAPNFKLELAGTSSVTDRKIGINGTQMVYLPDQTDFTASLFIGNGGQSLEHVAGNDGQYNTAVGIDALKVNTRGNMNIAVGSYVLDSNTTGSYNIAMGYSSMQANIIGSNNTAYGYRTLMSNTGGNNVAIGYQALYSNVANTRSTAVGYGAMQYADNRASGRETSNTAIGYEALRGNTTASQNTGRFNTAIGDNALRVVTGGQYNMAIGYQALVACSSGSWNVGLGTLTLNNLTTGNMNTAVGYGAVTGPALTNATSIGYATTANASNKVRIGNDNVTVYESVVAWTRPSDRRLKKNIKDSPLGLDFILKLKPKTFNLKKGHEGIEYTGLIAQEVEESLDSLDTDFDGLLRPHNKDDVYSLRYSTFIMPLINAIQEQQKQIDELRMAS